MVGRDTLQGHTAEAPIAGYVRKKRWWAYIEIYGVEGSAQLLTSLLWQTLIIRHDTIPEHPREADRFQLSHLDTKRFLGGGASHGPGFLLFLLAL